MGRVTDRLDMTIAVDWAVKSQHKQNKRLKLWSETMELQRELTEKAEVIGKLIFYTIFYQCNITFDIFH